MDELIKLDFDANEPRMTVAARRMFESWRTPIEARVFVLRKSGDWVVAGEFSHRVNAVLRMCRDLPQPVTVGHLQIVLGAVSEALSLATEEALVFENGFEPAQSSSDFSPQV
ncbi:hypothetical protein J7382_06795 [Shimia sp. R11_0]|uniref:hypothetical protein n=1 Tax=Shimia sp. R11_0 TaxID=2821096 RepID=UPI001ADC3CB8|nr:hypothetical protein [Shimia sp. R11_0]MBO9477236.1 hypothetical protein [Shimia sp. R11_0]